MRARGLSGIRHQRRTARRTGAVLCAALIVLFCGGLVRAQTANRPAPPSANAPPADAAEMQMPDMGNDLFLHVLFNQLEGRTDGANNSFRWDGEGWFGTDMNRLWLKSEGFADNGRVSDGDLEILYDRPLPRLRYFDGQVGIREDLDSGPKRTWIAVGVEGLAPGFFEFEPTFYFRDSGHVAGRVVASYDLFITQRLVAQPELEMNFYNKDDPQRRFGSGLSDLDTGVRMRYEIWRKFAPYAGFAYTREFGETARLARQIGESVADPRFVFGLRVWY